MDGIILLTDSQRKSALQYFRSGENARISRRAHILILLDRGWAYREIMDVMLCGSDSVADVKRSFLESGLESALGIVEAPTLAPELTDTICTWVVDFTPQDFGYFRTRWSCEILSEVLLEQNIVACSGETVRRWMHRFGFAWRRPRPIVGPSDPFYFEKMQRIRRLLRDLPSGEVAVFQDEVDINLNPKIGSQWMARGLQAEVETPGNNRKLYLSGSLVWTTGTLLVSEPQQRRNSDLFLTHLDDLRRRLRGYSRIHVICDNASFHKSKDVKEYLLDWNHRIQIHFLPAYSPQTNPIERVWWHLHETITRNHRCKTMEELASLASEWLANNNNHYADMRNTFALAA
jgi:transposase